MSAGFEWSAMNIGCIGKEAFHDRGIAKKIIARMSRRAASDSRGKLNAYRCERCGGWHIGGSQTSNTGRPHALHA